MQIECYDELSISFEDMIDGEVYLSQIDNEFYMKVEVFITDCEVEYRLLGLNTNIVFPKNNNDLYKEKFIPTKSTLRIKSYAPKL